MSRWIWFGPVGHAVYSLLGAFSAAWAGVAGLEVPAMLMGMSSAWLGGVALYEFRHVRELRRQRLDLVAYRLAIDALRQGLYLEAVQILRESMKKKGAGRGNPR